MYKIIISIIFPKLEIYPHQLVSSGVILGFKNILNTQKLLKLHFNTVAWYIIQKVLNFKQEIFQKKYVGRTRLFLSRYFMFLNISFQRKKESNYITLFCRMLSWHAVTVNNTHWVNTSGRNRILFQNFVNFQIFQMLLYS